MPKKSGIYPCQHCQESGTCYRKLSSIETILGFIPYFHRTSCALCLKASGENPHEVSLVTVCSVCRGKGKVWIGENDDGRRTKNE